MPFHRGRSKNLYAYLHPVVLLASLFLHPLYGYPTSENADISYLLAERGATPPADEEQMTAAELVTKLISAVILVLLGGIFAGLTIGLMGLDETNLQVLVEAGEEAERKYAQKVLDLLNHGKHWVLVTLLLSNVIVNESLPIIMDSVFGGGWPAVLISTALIVLFGEIIPQAICVRHGLAIGAWSSSLVLFLMYIMYPVARPIAELLDYCLGEHHGTMYRKSELKTFVSLHKNGGIESLNEDEVTIISAVLELFEKPVSAVMTPMADVYTLSSDHILDQATVDGILKAGYSRIPIYARPNPTNFIGMLLVKKLISYDPEDALPVKEFHLSSLPETSPSTSCLDILNFFQEGRSHMVLVSDDPGGDGIALGVITLEDVIEELIGEEIVDETDVYIDVHNKVEVVRRPPRHVRSRFLAKRQASYDVSNVNYTANALQLGLSPKVSSNNQPSSKNNLFLQKTMGQSKSSAGDDNIDKNHNNIDHSQTSVKSSIGNYGSTENERDSFATGKPSGEVLERESLLKK